MAATLAATEAAHYHQRSNVESTFSMMKRRRKFGGEVSGRSETSMANEVLCKCIAHNLSVLVHEIHDAGSILSSGGRHLTDPLRSADPIALCS